MDEAIANALKKKREFELAIKKLDDFIATYEELMGTKVVRDEMVSPPSSAEVVPSGPSSGPPPVVRKRNHPSQMADLAAKMIREAGRPLTRGELVEKIEASGTKIYSDDKPRYIGTILWRNSGRFENREGEGYWLKGVPLGEPDFLK